MGNKSFSYENDRDPKCILNVQYQNPLNFLNGDFWNRSNADRTF